METATSSVFTSNTSSSGHLPVPPSWNPGDLTHTVILGLGFLLGFFGNIAVIILKPNIHQLSPVTQSLMLNLAVSDLLCVLTLPFWIYDQLFSWTIGLVACKLLTYLLFLGVHGSLMTVTLLSVQRFLVVVKQINILNRFGPKRLLVLLWMASLIVSIPIGVARKVIDKKENTYCSLRLSTETVVMLVMVEEITVGFITLFIVAFSYICLYKKVNQAAFFNNPQTTRLVSSITVSFFILYFPYHVMNVLSLTAVSLHIEGVLEFCRTSRYSFGAIAILNSSLNPLLYGFTSCNLSKCTVKLNCLGRNPDVSQRQSNLTTPDAVS